MPVLARPAMLHSVLNVLETELFSLFHHSELI